MAKTTLAAGITRDGALRNRDLLRLLPAAAPEDYPAPETIMMVERFTARNRWITLDETYPPQMDEKIAWFRNEQTRSLAIAREDGTLVGTAENELLQAVRDEVLKRYPRYFHQEGTIVSCALTGIAVDFARLSDPLQAISCLLCEDMVLMLPVQPSPIGHRYRVCSGTLFFPNGWGITSAPGDTQTPVGLGKTASALHQGVNFYRKRFAEPVERWLAKIKAGEFFWRRNWGPQLCAGLNLHPKIQRDPQPVRPHDWDEGFVRCEQQSIVKLPESGAIVFGIKTYLWPLKALLQNKAAATALIRANRNLPPSMVTYRQPRIDTFRQWLSQQRL